MPKEKEIPFLMRMPPHLHKQLKEMAVREDRSLQKTILRILKTKISDVQAKKNV